MDHDPLHIIIYIDITFTYGSASNLSGVAGVLYTIRCIVPSASCQRCSLNLSAEYRCIRYEWGAAAMSVRRAGCIGPAEAMHVCGYVAPRSPCQPSPSNGLHKRTLTSVMLMSAIVATVVCCNGMAWITSDGSHESSTVWAHHEGLHEAAARTAPLSGLRHPL